MDVPVNKTIKPFWLKLIIFENEGDDKTTDIEFQSISMRVINLPIFMAA